MTQAMLKYSCMLLCILVVSFVKAQDTTTVLLNDTISPKGCQFYAGSGFTYYADEIRQSVSTDKTVTPGLYSIETKYGLAAKVRHISKNENIIYYYSADSIVSKIEYLPYFEISLDKDHYQCHDSDYKISRIYLYYHGIRLIDFSYRNEEFYIRVLKKKYNKSFTIYNMDVLSE